MSYAPGKEETDEATKALDESPPAAPPDQLASFWEVFSFGSGSRKNVCLTLGFLSAVVTGCVFPAMAFFFSKVFEDLGSSTDQGDFLGAIREIAFVFMILGVVAFTFMTAQSCLFETAAGIMTTDMRTKWFRALLRQDLAYYDIKDVSGTATIINSNALKYKKGTGRKCGEAVQFTITFFGGLGYAFWASWRASLVVLAVAPFMVLSGLFLTKMNQSQTARANASYAEAGSIVYTTVSSIRTILSLNAPGFMIDKFRDATFRAYQGAASQAHVVGLANGSIMGAFLLAYVALTLFGTYLLYDNVRDTGCDPSGTLEGYVDGAVTCDPAGVDVFGALMGITFGAAVLPQVTVAVEAFTGARSACFPALAAINRKLGDEDDGASKATKEQPSEDQRRGSVAALPKYEIDSSSEKGEKPKDVVGTVEFNSVSFAYPTRFETNVFDGFSLRIEAGKTVALVGPSGSGKSTSVQLIERFYDPQVGTITLDGRDIRTLNVKWLRQQIGMVGQEPALFACSIKENIAYGNPGASDEEIEQAARMANAHDFVVSFPDGYDTQVGDKGAQLSGGQKQRIAIARVLVKKPKILLLDEATSALDSESENIVQQALDNLLELGSMTSLVIAHRLSTIRNADMICVCDKGRIVETGTHDELIAKQGHYYDLVEAQKGNNAGDTNNSNPGSRKGSTVDLTKLDTSEQSTALLRFRNVHFRYPARPDNKIFRGLELDVREGETLALVGPSGHGKSTTIQLIERFYDPDQGTVEFMGVDMKELNVGYLRDQIGLVGQEPTLFDTTIAENIRYGYPDATMEEIEEAARMANAYNFINEFPDGFDTMVGSGGTQVSGGQKQRIAIARALIKKPRILLLDEATSALDSESEKVVQQALDNIMSSKNQTVVVIAHRLSTIRDADRIAVVENGKVREIGSHDELMAKEDGHYRKLQMYQNLDRVETMKATVRRNSSSIKDSTTDKRQRLSIQEMGVDEIDKEAHKKNSKRAWLMATQDRGYFLIGGIGALVAGLIFPGWGVIFSYMIDLLYTPVLPCADDAIPPGFDSCDEYFNSEADDMRELSFKITYGYIAMMAATMFGNMLLFYGFGTASERMNKRVRDAAFESLVRQEVSYFDVRPVSMITTQLQEDAALLHSFSGEPIRTLILNTSSVLVGLVVSFFFMWPFALLTLAILPFMAFGAEMEMKMYMGEDEADITQEDETSPGGIVVETLLNIRTVASLTIEEKRAVEYEEALAAEDPHPIRSNITKGGASGLGQFVQMWGMALMFWWGGWLLVNYPGKYEYRDFLISMFSLMFALSGLGVAAQGATNRDKAKLAAARIFELTDRESAIDPLGQGGQKDLTYAERSLTQSALSNGPSKEVEVMTSSPGTTDFEVTLAAAFERVESFEC